MPTKDKLPKLSTGQKRIMRLYSCMDETSRYLWSGSGVMLERTMKCLERMGVVKEGNNRNRIYFLTDLGKIILKDFIKNGKKIK